VHASGCAWDHRVRFGDMVLGGKTHEEGDNLDLKGKMRKKKPLKTGGGFRVQGESIAVVNLCGKQRKKKGTMQKKNRNGVHMGTVSPSI